MTLWDIDGDDDDYGDADINNYNDDDFSYDNYIMNFTFSQKKKSISHFMIWYFT